MLRKCASSFVVQIGRSVRGRAFAAVVARPFPKPIIRAVMAGARRISTEKRASIIAQHNIDTEIFKEKLKPQVSSDIDEKKIWELQSKYSDCQLQVKLAEAEDIALKTADSNKKLHQADKDLAAAFEQINKFLDQIEARASAERMKQWNCYNLVKDAERDTKPHNPRRGGWK